jgi:mucin-19
VPSFLKTTAGGKVISGGALQPRGRRGNTAQVAAYWAGGSVEPLMIEYFAVGGGGGRSPGVYGAYWGAGGAGGAAREGTILSKVGTYTCTVGGWGGNCGNGGSSTIVHNIDGTIASARYGGAAGGTTGGGNGDFSGGTQGGLDGGGGAGANGNGGQGGFSGVGGAGKASSITGSSLTYGGGGGGNFSNGSIAANGSSTSGYGTGGQANGALDSNCGSGSTPGTAGVVYIRYLTSVKSDNGYTITGGTVSTVGAYTLHAFTSTGTLVIA